MGAEESNELKAPVPQGRTTAQQNAEHAHLEGWGARGRQGSCSRGEIRRRKSRACPAWYVVGFPAWGIFPSAGQRAGCGAAGR